MPGQTPLPSSTRRIFDGLDLAEAHPGLLLDKYPPSWDTSAEANKLQERVQRPTLDAVASASRPPADLDYADLHARRDVVFRQMNQEGTEPNRPESRPNTRLGCLSTEVPLTLHLSRASSLENAGTCLHPVYGFAYLPSTGLKGVARAYAETVWLTGRPARSAAWRLIEQVFGYGPRSDELEPGAVKPWKPADAPEHGETDPSACGQVVFHDAWPVTWPALVVDIVNNHHSKYYGGTGAPGDWEEPIPVYFLSIRPGQEFSFAVSRRRADAPPIGSEDSSEDPLALAWEWLCGGLARLGFGAKTHSGYGFFRPSTPPVPHGAFAESDATLELITPAFLAGAGPFEKDPADCDLRPATLRGLLRWWWRTLYAGFVSPQTLKRIEACVWGDTAAGSAVQIVVRPDSVAPAKSYDKRAIAKKENLPEPPNNKTTQGLWYHSYGMNDQKGPRFYIEPGSKWSVSLSARPSRYIERHPNGRPRVSRDVPDPRDVLRQAEAALWLLCHFGGVGSKSRRGFGCFAEPASLHQWNLDECRAAAVRFRQLCGVQTIAATACPSPSLQQIIAFSDVPGLSPNYWKALDKVGQAAQKFAQRYAHNREKKALGLPRNVKPRHDGSFLGAPFTAGPHVKDRHASPVIYHLFKDAAGIYGLRVTAFPSPELPNDLTSQRSRNFLDLLLTDLTATLTGGGGAGAGTGPRTAAFGRRPSVAKTGVRIGKGHAPTGVLKRVGGSWTAVFSGDAKFQADARNVRISNAADLEKLSGDLEGRAARFTIKSADDKDGILARFDGLA